MILLQQSKLISGQRL